MPQLLPFTPDQITTLRLEEVGVRDGGSPSESFDMDATTATRLFHCDWAERFNAVRYFVGEVSTYDAGGGVTRLSRTVPQRHPKLPHLIATKVVNVRGHGWTSYDDEYPDDSTALAKINAYRKASFTVLYEHAGFEVLSDQEMESPDESLRYWQFPLSVDPSGELLTLPGGGGMKYLDPAGAGPAHNKPIPYNVGIVVPQATVKAKWWRLPEDAWNSGSTLWQRVFGDGGDPPYLGTVNKYEWQGFPGRTLLFNNVVPLRRKEPTGEFFLGPGVRVRLQAVGLAEPVLRQPGQRGRRERLVLRRPRVGLLRARRRAGLRGAVQRPAVRQPAQDLARRTLQPSAALMRRRHTHTHTHTHAHAQIVEQIMAVDFDALPTGVVGTFALEYPPGKPGTAVVALSGVGLAGAATDARDVFRSLEQTQRGAAACARERVREAARDDPERASARARLAAAEAAVDAHQVALADAQTRLSGLRRDAGRVAEGGGSPDYTAVAVATLDVQERQRLAP